MEIDSEDYDDFPERPSKSSLKRDSAALQDFAAELADLPESQLKNLELPQMLYDALCEAALMPPKGARKRLLKYIGGMLREMDVEPIREKFAQITYQSAHATREHHNIEHWRDRLISGDKQALTELVSDYPAANVQQFSQLIRNSKKETDAGRPPKSYREIYRMLRELFAIDEH